VEVNLINEPEKHESRLVEAAVTGDLESFGQLCQRYYAAMAAIAYSVLADHQLAEDAAQEGFARALVNLRNLKNKTRFAPWLAAICRNVAKDIVAAKARQVTTEDFSQAAQDSNPDESILIIRRAIEQLPASAKELIVLRYYNNLSYDEIGSMLGISKATINGRLTRAKRKMKKYLRRSGFPENQL
jgi:RNA polymerase sigma-70 factor (ECF subfamily)